MSWSSLRLRLRGSQRRLRVRRLDELTGVYVMKLEREDLLAVMHVVR